MRSQSVRGASASAFFGSLAASGRLGDNITSSPSGTRSPMDTHSLTTRLIIRCFDSSLAAGADA